MAEDERDFDEQLYSIRRACEDAANDLSQVSCDAAEMEPSFEEMEQRLGEAEGAVALAREELDGIMRERQKEEADGQ